MPSVLSCVGGQGARGSQGFTRTPRQPVRSVL
jgi:hypothetical protein